MACAGVKTNWLWEEIFFFFAFFRFLFSPTSPFFVFPFLYLSLFFPRNETAGTVDRAVASPCMNFCFFVTPSVALRVPSCCLMYLFLVGVFLKKLRITPRKKIVLRVFYSYSCSNTLRYSIICINSWESFFFVKKKEKRSTPKKSYYRVLGGYTAQYEQLCVCMYV